MWPAGNWSEILRQFSESRDTYRCSGAIREEYGVVDLHIATIGSNSTTLEVACPPPGIGAKKVQETSETRFRSTYSCSSVSAVALERAGVDLDICIPITHSSALKVVCDPPGIGTNI